jgi:hypothetical protein
MSEKTNKLLAFNNYQGEKLKLKRCTPKSKVFIGFYGLCCYLHCC